MLKLEQYVFQKFNEFYSNEEDFYNIKIINEIICNDSTHIVAIFKDFLISGDTSEFLQKSYSLRESRECLPKIFEYYDSCSVIFPNYVILFFLIMLFYLNQNIFIKIYKENKELLIINKI